MIKTKIFLALFIILVVPVVSYVSYLDNLSFKKWIGVIHLSFTPDDFVNKVDEHTYILKYKDGKYGLKLARQLEQGGWIGSLDPEFGLLKGLSLIKNKDGTFSSHETYPILGGSFLITTVDSSTKYYQVLTKETNNKCLIKKGIDIKPFWQTSDYFLVKASQIEAVASCKP